MITEADTAVAFKLIPSCPGYRAGSDGSIWSNRQTASGAWKRIKPHPVSKEGHLGVNIFPGPRKRLVHHLVLEAFVGPRPEGMECCHFPDHSPANNRIDNLRWDTSAANKADTVRQGRRPPANRKLSIESVGEIKKLLGMHPRLGDRTIARRFGVQRTTIQAIRTGHCWKYVVSALDKKPEENGEERDGE